MTPAPAKQATYLSRVLDADFHARWGLLRWHGTHELGVETRSGNTAKPDATWSGFAELDHPRATGDGGVGLVASPAARYVQYRRDVRRARGARRPGDAGLPAAEPARADHRDQRRRQRGGGAALDRRSLGALGGASLTPAAATRSHTATLKLHWKVDNTDGDDLVYRLFFREENDAVWRPLGGPDPLTKTDFDWNTEGLPDGTYVVRVVASDERSEPRERALEASLDSAPILVDNRKPEVAGLGRQVSLRLGARARRPEPAHRPRVRRRRRRLAVLAPADGICDDLVEAFTLKLPTLPPGPHAVTVRAWDSADNVGAASVTVRVGGK